MILAVEAASFRMVTEGYHVQIVRAPSDDSFLVNFQKTGVHGSTRAICGTRTRLPVSIQEALAIFRSIVADKLDKGFDRTETTLPADVKLDESAGLDATSLDPDFTAPPPPRPNEVTLDDTRISGAISNDRIIGLSLRGALWRIGRKNKQFISGTASGAPPIGPLADGWKADVEQIGGDFELIGYPFEGKFYACDILSVNERSLREETLFERLRALCDLLNGARLAHVQLADVAMGKTEKRELFEDARHKNYSVRFCELDKTVANACDVAIGRFV